MKSLLNLIRVMVALSMPAAGFFLAMAAEGQYIAFGQYLRTAQHIHQRAEKAPSAITVAETETLRLIGPSLAYPRAMIEQLSWTAFAVCSMLCALSIWAGRKVKYYLRHFDLDT